MFLCFQTLLSGSSGNLLMLWTPRTRLIVDAGVSAQKRLRAILEEHRRPPVAAVLVSHLHGDHINYSTLRVLEQTGHPLYVHRRNRRPLLMKHTRGLDFTNLRLEAFGDGTFQVGDFTIHNFETEHDGGSRNCGFVIECEAGRRRRKVVLATDFCEWEEVADRFVDADLLYLEANHDPELLRLNPNFNSHYHLSNLKTGRLLAHALERSSRPPRAVVLGHLSAERNTPALALETVRDILEQNGHRNGLSLHVAPRSTPSPVFTV